MILTEKQLIRFWSKINKTSDAKGCWNWVGYKKSSGHGQIRINKKTIYVHRLSYELHFGPIEKNILVLHKPEPICHNSCCINPEHLYTGTHTDNQNDRTTDGTSNRGERCGSNKLTTDKVFYIRENKYTYDEYAKMFNVSISTIYDIVNNRTWKHI